MPTLIDFHAADEAARWHSLSDGVMGGASHGAMHTEPASSVFSGELSLSNGSGFFRLALSRLETLGKESATGASQETAPPPRLRLVYDGECPICRRYVRWQRIRKEVGEFELIDARQDSEARQELTALGIDLDQGFALQIGKRWYHGSEALQRLTLLGTRSGVFNRLMHRLFASPGRTARLYPLLRACRNGLLRVLGKPRIGNTRHW